MEKISKQGKNLEETLSIILEENNLKIEDVVYASSEKKGGLFKSAAIEVAVYEKKHIHDMIKEYLKNIINGLGLEVSFEVIKKDEKVVIKMYSNDNPILIGKNGQTIRALETMIRQMLKVKYNINYMVNLDVENYKTKKENNLIKLAKRTAKEVVNTNIEAHLDNMTSYERRIVHNALTNFKGVVTESEGQDPNRHIVIKPKK